MTKQTRTYTLFAVLGVVGIFIAGAIISDAQSTTIPDSFAQCVTESGATMYGAFWCPHCESQKQSFGKSFDHINYVECSLPDRSGQTQICIDENIQSYPTWEFGDGSRELGEVPLELIAERTGCELPSEDA